MGVGGVVQDEFQAQLIKNVPKPLKEIVKKDDNKLQKINDLYSNIWEHRSEIELPSLGKNLFVDLAENIAGELNVSSC